MKALMFLLALTVCSLIHAQNCNKKFVYTTDGVNKTLFSLESDLSITDCPDSLLSLQPKYYVGGQYETVVGRALDETKDRLYINMAGYNSYYSSFSEDSYVVWTEVYVNCVTDDLILKWIVIGFYQPATGSTKTYYGVD